MSIHSHVRTWARNLALLCSFALLGAACGDDEVTPPGDDAPDAMVGEPLTCQVAIVGGGPGGLHTAFRLAPTMGDGVCLFEKEAELGGRIKDVPMDPSDANSPRFGTGAMRVMEGQNVLFDLATELGIEFETPDLTDRPDYINARGQWSFGKEGLVGNYGVTPDVGGDTETALYYALDLQAARPNIGDYADFRSYIRAKVGAEGLAFLHDMSRFRADFEYPVDAASYMDFLDEEWDVCCTPSYPIGGMSRFIVGMEDAAVADGAQIFKSEPVSVIERADGGGYRLITSGHVVTAQSVVIAIPPDALNWLSGDIVDEIRAQGIYQEIIGVKVATVAQWWPSDWYTGLEDPNNAVDGKNIWRAWSTEHCFNAIEMPLQPYAHDQLVTRSVYDDDRNCVDYWESLNNIGGTAAVEAEIKTGLEYMFNTMADAETTPITLPDPDRTYVQIWPNAWHWLRAGAQHSNAELFDWAVEPLTGEDVGMVGEAYNVNRSGWSDGAYKSSINLLNMKYGLSLPGLGRPAPHVGPRHDWTRH